MICEWKCLFVKMIYSHIIQIQDRLVVVLSARAGRHNYPFFSLGFHKTEKKNRGKSPKYNPL